MGLAIPSPSINNNININNNNKTCRSPAAACRRVSARMSATAHSPRFSFPPGTLYSQKSLFRSISTKAPPPTPGTTSTSLGLFCSSAYIDDNAPLVLPYTSLATPARSPLRSTTSSTRQTLATTASHRSKTRQASYPHSSALGSAEPYH